MPTKKEVERSNAVSFAQLLEELKRVNPAINDLYYDDHNGVWCIAWKDERRGGYEELETFMGTFFTVFTSINPA